MIDKYYRFNLPKLVKSFTYAFAGIHFAVVHNQNLRIHITVGLVIVALSIFFHVNPFEMGILGVMILLVIASEMINTAIEEMANLITKEHREEARIAKDVSAGMVLVAALGSVVVGFLIFFPYVLRFMKSL